MNKIIITIIVFCVICLLIFGYMGQFERYLLSGQDRINNPMIVSTASAINNEMQR
jgi:hypothetical protein